MWQYTTETIINSTKGNIGGTKRFDVVDNKLLIEGVGSFDLKNIAAVYKTPYMEAQNALHKLVFAYDNKVKAGETLRLQIWVSEEGSIRPELQNAFLMKKLPFHFEIISTGVELDDVKKFVELINRSFAKKGAEKLFIASPASGDEAAIVIEATDCYIRLNKMQLVEVMDEQMLKGSIEDINQAALTALAGLGRANLTGYQNYVEIAVSETPVRPGREGNGTVARLVKNLRIPTKASLNPFGSDHGGKPVPGGEYDQYLIQYVVDRSHMGHQVVGSVADKSMTSHVLFIEKRASEVFAQLLSEKGKLDVTATADADREVKEAADMKTVVAEGAEGAKPTKR